MKTSVLTLILALSCFLTSNNRHPEVVPYIEAVVKTAFSDVRRLAPVDGEASFNLSGEVVNFGKEILSFLLEPLKDPDTVYLKYETVFLLRITFKFCLGVFGGELLIMLR